MPLLTQEHVDQYKRDGYVLVSGLIPEETIARAETAMWSALGMDPEDSETWSSLPKSSDGVVVNEKLGLIQHFGLQHPDLLACCTSAFYEAQSELVQENPDAFHCGKPEPEALWTRSVFPVQKAWRHEGAHVDGGHRPFGVFPGTFRVSSLTYLDEGLAQGGGTMVWPGTHKMLRELAMHNPEKYREISDFKPLQENFDMGDPVEIRPARGDVLFFHYLLVHGGSLNTSHKPRFALRWVCTCEKCRIWAKHGKWNIWMP